MLIKQFEILWELPKCDTETQSEQILTEKMAKKKTCLMQICHKPSICKKTKQNQYLYSEMKLRMSV